jgi:hypothetical protein
MSNDGGNKGTDGPAGGASSGGNYGGNRNLNQTTNIGAGSNKTNELAKEQKTKEKEFINSGKVENPFLTLKPIDKALKKGSVYTRTFFSNSVLSKKGVTYKGTKYSKTEFQNFSITKQNEIYGDYLNKRMQGSTDAYGNINSGWREDSKGNLIRTADADPVIKKNETQVETESKKITEEENKKNAITEEEKEENYKKIKGLKGARSMFGNAGGRGYFDPAQ